MTVTGTFAWIELMLVGSAGGELSPYFVWTFFLGLVPLVLLGVFLPAIAKAGGAPSPTGKL